MVRDRDLMNVFHDVFLPRSGAGSMPWSNRIRLTVFLPISCPRFRRASRILVYPQLHVFLRHPHHEFDDLLPRRRPARSAFPGAVVLLGHELPVPAEDRVRGNDVGELPEELASEDLALDREAASLIVVEPESSVFELLTQDAVLLLQVVDDLVLVAVHPAGNGEEEEVEWVRMGGRGHVQRFDPNRPSKQATHESPSWWNASWSGACWNP